MSTSRRLTCRSSRSASAWSPARPCSPTGWLRREPIGRRVRATRIGRPPGSVAPAPCEFVYTAGRDRVRKGSTAMRSPKVRVRVRMRERTRRPRLRGRRLPHLSVNRMIPNVLTLLALCAGMTAIRFAINGEFTYATFAIIAAGVFDGLDGRLARLLKATSKFGAELDSLSDFISFGVAPAAVLYLWTMAQLHSVGWAIVLFYAVCCALRLARFNI